MKILIQKIYFIIFFFSLLNFTKNFIDNGIMNNNPSYLMIDNNANVKNEKYIHFFSEKLDFAVDLLVVFLDNVYVNN